MTYKLLLYYVSKYNNIIVKIYESIYRKSFVGGNEYRIRAAAGQRIVQAVLPDVPDKLAGPEFLSGFHHVLCQFYCK